MVVRLVINPPADAELHAAAAACMSHGAVTPEVLGACLRGDYPRVAVHDGVDIGTDRLWYVFREGYWIAGDGS